MPKHQFLRVPVRISFVLQLCCAVLLFGLPLFAQVNTGQILGTVTDQTGSVIVGAKVTVTNTGTGVARNLTTNQAGAYAAPNLLPGTYSVGVSAMGFKTFQRQNVTVGVGQATSVNAQLTPGQVTQTVEITAAAPMIDTTSAIVSGTLNTQTILNLPLNGRNYQNLLPLRPGVVQQPGGGSLTTATNGLRPSDNNYFIEGLDNNEPFTGQSITNTTLPFGDAASLLPVDAIQELNVETNAPAEFGRRPGAVINVAIKSGTNAIHGSAFAFGRDGAWDATDFVNPPVTPQPVQFQQWGGTAGGPIIKNKLFYFGGFERQSYSVGNEFPTDTPTSKSLATSANPAGDPSQSVPDAEAGLAANNIPVSPTSLKLLPLYGTNNGPSSAITIGFPDVFSINNAIGKMDYHPNDRHTITGSFFFGNGHAIGEDNPFTQPFFLTTGTMRAEFLTTSWTWTPSSTWVNDLRFGWNHYNRTTTVGDNNTPSANYGLNTGVTASNLLGLPNIRVSGFGPLGGDVNSPKAFGPASDYDFVDHVSYLHGNHSFKFGAEVLYYRAFFDQVSAGRGEIFFKGNAAFPGSTGLEDFLAGTADHVNLLEGNPARTFTQWDFSGFFEDSWRVTDRLTLNMGIRYEYYTPLSEIHNLIGNWSPTVGFEQVGVNLNHSYNADSKDFSPRLGIAWDITGKGTTVVRAGAGLYYANTPAAQFITNIALPGHTPGISSIPTAYTLYMPDGSTVAPLNSTSGIGSTVVTIPGTSLNWDQTGGGTVYPPSSTSGFACGNGLGSNPNPCSVLATSPNLPTTRVGSWNIGIEHAFTPAISAEVDYIGNAAWFLPAITDLNQIDPNSAAELACGNCESITHLPYYSKFPYLRYIDFMTNSDISNYNALQATLTARAFHNLSFIAGYTYSHALTDLPGSGYSQPTPQNSLNAMGDYGASNFDIRHHFSFAPTYILPSRKSPLQLLEGWSVQSAILIETGLPWGPVDGRDLSLTNEGQDRWDYFGNPSAFESGPNPIPFFPGSGIAVIGQETTNSPCNIQAEKIGAGAMAALAAYGCYAQGGAIMIPPAAGQFGTMARNLFYGSRFVNWDFSVFKDWRFKERLTAQFRVEIFNILNHTNIANPGLSGFNDPSAGSFGCGCETPDQASTNPVLGTGGARALQLGLKLLF
jgi:Carboxypeptidase regulatory-like domain/TonB dependent receptor-like, beta-barrel